MKTWIPRVATASMRCCASWWPKTSASGALMGGRRSRRAPRLRVVAVGLQGLLAGRLRELKALREKAQNEREEAEMEE